MKSDKDKATVTRITEIYAAVFTVKVFDDDLKAETILAGYQNDPNNPKMARARATIETQVSAVPDLVAMCDEILSQQKEIETYRLLKFDKNGIHELNPDEFRQVDRISFKQYPEGCWGLC
jgi:hypothetical protein